MIVKYVPCAAVCCAAADDGGEIKYCLKYEVSSAPLRYPLFSSAIQYESFFHPISLNAFVAFKFLSYNIIYIARSELF